VSGEDRGQLVLLAAAVIAFALVPLAIAYLQLGYVGDLESEPGVESGGSPGVHATSGAASERAVHDAIERTALANLAAVAGDHEWENRGEAVTIYRSALREDLDELEGAALDDGVIVTLRVAPADALAWAREACPTGRNREFGACVADDGIVIQERAGTATVAAVAIEVRIASEDATRESLIVVEMPG
jgi:hypothetical protein